MIGLSARRVLLPFKTEKAEAWRCECRRWQYPCIPNDLVSVDWLTIEYLNSRGGNLRTVKLGLPSLFQP
jgi:hypothetical protein